MVLRRDQRFTDSQAENIKQSALKRAAELHIEKKIRYLLSHGNSRYTDQGKQMALPGTGMILFADFTGLNDFVTKVTHAETGNLVYHSLRKGGVIERFRSGAWVSDLDYEYAWIEWKTDNPRAADLVDRFGVINNG